MKKSIIQPDASCCYLCGSTQNLERHHIFGGANRKLSEKYGLTVRLCHCCHNEPPQGVHHNAETMLALHWLGQVSAMDYYHWTITDFRQKFGKNYL